MSLAPSACRRNALTDRQHRVLRQQLALIPAYAWGAYIWSITLSELPLAPFRQTAKAFRDFALFYALGVIARLKDAPGLYDMQAQQRLIASMVPEQINVSLPPVYGPQVSLLFAPLSFLSYETALLVWLFVTVVFYVACGALVWRSAPGLRGHGWTYFVLLASAPAFHLLIMYGQTTALALCCLVGAYLALKRGSLFTAGFAIGGLFYKPQLGLAAAVLLVGASQWRAVTGAMLAVLAQLAAAAVYWGPGMLVTYASQLFAIQETLPLMEPAMQHLHSWRTFLALLGLGGGPLLIATLALTAVTLAFALWAWRQPGDLRLRFLALSTATILVSPHLHGYDLVLLLPSLAVLWEYLATAAASRAPYRLVAQGLLIAAFVAPLSPALAVATRVQLTVPVMASLLAYAGMCLGNKTAAKPASP